MINNSLNLSNKLPIQICEILECIKTIADDLNIPILLIGATARDLVLQYAHNIQPYRETKDIDFGVAARTWDEFAILKDRLKESDFEEKAEHRMQHLLTGKIIDLIPFGDIEYPLGKITFQNNNEMITSGFTEAFETGLDVEFVENLTIKTASPVGLALLKLVAWIDRNSNKDSQDFWLIVKNYLDLGNEERLYLEVLDLLEDASFDNTEAGARLLGRDLSKLLNEQTRPIVSLIFENDKRLQKLAFEIYRAEGKIEDDSFNKILSVLTCFHKGLQD